MYYAYGIRNSFGLDFDPVTGILWDTENGPDNGDEINLVEAGFNSNSAKIWGKWLFDAEGDKLKNPDKNSKERFVTVTGVPDDLVYFDGKGHYIEPEFIWDKTVAHTGLIFLDSQSLGQEYENDLFVDFADNSRFFHFDLSDDRRDLVLESDISDKVAKNSEDYCNSLFGEGFFLITDLEVGPEDGYLYIVTPFKISKKVTLEQYIELFQQILI